MNPSETYTVNGGCLCGKIRFSINGPLSDVTICHCAMCRRASTSVGAYSACAPEAITMTGKPRWYRSSPIARGRFCARCGSSLFWEPSHRRHLSVALGSLDDATGLKIAKHLFLAEDRGPMRALATLGDDKTASTT